MTTTRAAFTLKTLRELPPFDLGDGRLHPARGQQVGLLDEVEHLVVAPGLELRAVHAGRHGLGFGLRCGGRPAALTTCVGAVPETVQPAPERATATRA